MKQSREKLGVILWMSEESIRRIKEVEGWREKKLEEMRRTGRVPRSTDSMLHNE